MRKDQFETLINLIEGKHSGRPPVGYISDSAWLPGWRGIRMMDYFGNDEHWFQSHLASVTEYKDIIFFPGFWAEYGMCTEPSAFGSKPVWMDENLPHAEMIIESIEQAEKIQDPNVEIDGLLPLVINRMQNFQNRIVDAGHEIKMATSRGPFTIAQFLIGADEFMISMKIEPDATKVFLDKITSFIERWMQYQKSCFGSIEGIQMHDDVIGFVGKNDFEEFALPYLKRIYSSIDAKVKMFHNDANGMVCGPYLEEAGINIFNFSYNHSMKEMRQACGENVVLMGNIPPIEMLIQGNPDMVMGYTKDLLNEIGDDKRVLISAGGGLPQGAQGDNIKAAL